MIIVWPFYRAGTPARWLASDRPECVRLAPARCLSGPALAGIQCGHRGQAVKRHGGQISAQAKAGTIRTVRIMRQNRGETC